MRCLYVTTVSGTINAFLIPHIKMLIDLGHTVDVACSITNPIDKKIYDYGCNIKEINFSRSPLSIENYNAYKEVKKLIDEGDYDLVHTHTPIASAIVRLACKNIEETKVFYTAHGFHFHKGAPLKNWLIYYPLEKWLAKYTDTLITINKEDYERAKSKFKAKRVEYIPGVGLDIDKFKNVVVDKVEKRQELSLPEDSFIVLSVGELNKNKNHEVVLRAIAKLNNPIIHYVICGRGPLEYYLKKLVAELGVERNIHLLGFRKDIPEICKISDVFAFPSHREGLPVSVMEAMASGLPVICSNIRGNHDLILDGIGGYLRNPDDVNGFAKYINELISDSGLRSEFRRYNLKKIGDYCQSNVIKVLELVYKKDEEYE